jgi:hypothetical protein
MLQFAIGVPPSTQKKIQGIIFKVIDRELGTFQISTDSFTLSEKDIEVSDTIGGESGQCKHELQGRKPSYRLNVRKYRFCHFYGNYQVRYPRRLEDRNPNYDRLFIA